MRRILTLTHHGFDGQPDVRLVRLPFPRRAVLVGHLQPSPAEARLRPPGPHFRAFDCDLDLFDQPLMQLEWDRMARKRR